MNSLRIAIVVGLVLAAASLAGRAPTVDTLPLAAVLSFRDLPEEVDGLRQLEDRIFQEAFRAKAWRLVERRRVDAILAEKTLQGSLGDSCSATTLGGMLGVRTLLLPEFDRVEGVSRVSLRELEVSTGAVLRMAEAETEEPLTSSSRRLAHLLVGRLLDDPSVPLSDSGALRIESDPSTRVWVDGVEVGTTPTTLPVAPGLHRVAVEPGLILPPPREKAPDVSATTIVVVEDHEPPHHHHRYHEPPPPYQPAAPSDDKGDARTGAAVAGAVAAVAGVALVAAAANMPDSVWADRWIDVRVRTADTAVAVFRREENSGKMGVGVLGAIALFLGAALLVLAASAD